MRSLLETARHRAGYRYLARETAAAAGLPLVVEALPEVWPTAAIRAAESCTARTILS
jgi:hypothetical protein